MTLALNLERLHRIQATLWRRVALRDPRNIQSIGFTPRRQDCDDVEASLPVTVQFGVWHKRAKVAQAKRIERIEPLRLRDRRSGRFHQLSFPTDVVEVAPIQPTGVSVTSGAAQATSSAVVRWTTFHPEPPPPVDDGDGDPRWRWGVLTVSHLFADPMYLSAATATQPFTANSDNRRVRVERQAFCGQGPHAVNGRMVARGRLPGGPDLALVETGLERLWLSGFLPRISAPAIEFADLAQLARWTAAGTSGSLFGDGVHLPWRWLTFYPKLAIARLGNLQNVVRYELPGSPEHSFAPDEEAPLRPGTSGSVLVAGGIPLGLQVAATHPAYRIGYAQALATSMPWLRTQLRATQLCIVSMLGGHSSA